MPAPPMPAAADAVEVLARDAPPRLSDHVLAPALSSLWDFADPAGSRKRFLADAEAALARGDIRRQLCALTQAARAAGLQGDFAAALRLLDAVDAAIGQATAAAQATAPATPWDGPAVAALPEAEARLRSRLERGRVARSSGHPDEARPHFLDAVALGRAAGFDALTIDAMHMVAILGPPEAALRWNEEALAVARGSAQPDAQRWQASLLNNMGWSSMDLGRPADALARFEAAVPLRETMGDAGALLAARWAVGRALRALGRCQEALVLQRDLASTPAGDRDGYVHEEIGECLLTAGEGEAARPSFRRAAELLGADPWFKEHEAARLARIRELGK